MGENWQALSSLNFHWQANIQALHRREPELAQALAQFQPELPYWFMPEEHQVRIARKNGERIEPIDNPVAPAAARQIASKLYPCGKCTEPVMVAGLDQGWLWQMLYDLPCDTPAKPGYRPPLYFLCREIERLWLVLHVHDWSRLLSDARVRLFVGHDAAEHCRNSMMQYTHVPWAKLCVTIDPSIWPAGVSVHSLWQSAHQSANDRMQQLNRQIEAMYAGADVKAIASRLRGQPLRVMGITSFYTTFLKYSMSDWLEAFNAMGHQTRLAIEQNDHEIANPIYFAEQVIAFKPDLLLMIDHYRGEITGLPRQVPCVMWVQDRLPNIFSAKAGAAQGPRDYCVGFGRLHLRDAFGYPQQRFLPAQVGVNESRFAPSELSQADLEAYGCDISFVSHASEPATAILTEQLNRADAAGRKLLIDIFEQMRGVYDAGGAITQPAIIRRMLDASLLRYRAPVDEPTRRQIHDFFTQRVNNALYRHQSLGWAAEMDLDLRLYGRGWEQHPRFGRFARGVACNQTQLLTIYQASKINLQITPFGAVHQRLLDGLAAGGFFLLRYCPGDVVEPIYRQIWQWCCANGIEDDTALTQRATPQIREMLQQIQRLLDISPFDLSGSFIDVLKLSADGDYIRSAASVWPDQYGSISFDSQQQLQRHVTNFLNDPNQRRQIAAKMRGPVIEKFSYAGISRRLLEFIADDMARDVFRQGAAA